MIECKATTERVERDAFVRVQVAMSNEDGSDLMEEAIGLVADLAACIVNYEDVTEEEQLDLARGLLTDLSKQAKERLPRCISHLRKNAQATHGGAN